MLAIVTVSWTYDFVETGTSVPKYTQRENEQNLLKSTLENLLVVRLLLWQLWQNEAERSKMNDRGRRDGGGGT